MTSQPNNKRLGKGFAFPMIPVGSFARVDGADAVLQALWTLLSTEPGERVQRPDWGCGLRRYLFAPNTVNTRASMRRDVISSIERFERRAQLESVEVRPHEAEPTRVDIEIRFEVVGSRSPRNLVYPFYLQSNGAPS